MIKKFDKFFSLKVKELFPRSFWMATEPSEYAGKNMLLDMYRESEQSDFTVADMLKTMLCEHTLYELEFIANKKLNTFYWLSCTPFNNQNEFFELDAKECFSFLKNNMDKCGMDSTCYLDYYGENGVLSLCDDAMQYVRNYCNSENSSFSFETETIGDIIKGLNAILNLYSKLDAVTQRKTDKELSVLSNRALLFVYHIFFVSWRISILQ